MDESFQKVAKLSDFRLSKSKEARLDDLHLALFSVDGIVFVVENNCPHQHFEVLHQGHLEGCIITCPMHGRTFDLETGNCLNGAGKLRKLDVKTIDDEVWVKKPVPTSFSLFDK
ncbi:MAG: nitrite reductase (NAD(P)H) small subunit [Ignavibacteriales bacterium]|nr:nitrite reductase (NAD(P)H) small subunit [Ignavibacteriales bacterium]